nr:MAG TPA: hypothetical protein [Caudoviricetes sp.]
MSRSISQYINKYSLLEGLEIKESPSLATSGKPQGTTVTIQCCFGLSVLTKQAGCDYCF